VRKSLIDTDIVSEIRKFKNTNINAKAIAYRAIWQQYTISVITVYEIIKGWRKINRNDRIQEFLADLSQLEF
jgi:tRNA(fMet)-specific endonuclease VapC